MVDYSSVIDVLRSPYYVDRTGCFSTFGDWEHVTLLGCEGTGSSLFLRTFACYLDKEADSVDAFRHLDVGKSESFSRCVNAFKVLYLDFSDFGAETFEDALGYLAMKMMEAYRLHYRDLVPDEKDSCYSFNSYGTALDIIEGSVSEDDLSGSLRRLVSSLRGYESYRKKGVKLALLIDNMVRLETVSAKWGYYPKMKEFLKRFIVQDVYKYTDIFLQISDIAEERYDCYLGRNITLRWFSAMDYGMMGSTYREIAVGEGKYPFDCKLGVWDDTAWDEVVRRGRILVAKERIRDRLSERSHEKEMKALYAEELPLEVPRCSRNFGVRTKTLPKGTPAYEKMNALLRELHTKFYPDFRQGDIYKHLQILQMDVPVIKSESELEKILEDLPGGNPYWEKGSVNPTHRVWMQVMYSVADKDKQTYPGVSENVKAYAFVKDGDPEDLFVGSLRYLLSHAKHCFAAKLGYFSRSDQMCFWLSEDDFIFLEEFFRPYFPSMEASLPFVAYKGKLGISKEFSGFDDSHNSTVAHILSDYLKRVSAPEYVDMEKMVGEYVGKWNGDIYEDSRYGSFREQSALSLIVMLDSFDAILENGGQLGSDSFLLRGGSMWTVLSRSRCWADVGKNYRKMLAGEYF